MAFVLRDGLFQVKCRRPGCPFRSEFKIPQTIAGETERDCEMEAMKIAQNMGVIKHDATYGRTHTLTDALIRKVKGAYVAYGATGGHESAPGDGLPHPPGSVAVRAYARGDVIVRKGERATTVCEVLAGSAHPEHTDAIRYTPGRSFGAAGLLSNQARTGSVLADEDRTIIAFYNIQELSKTNPPKARELYNEIMEDTLHVVSWLDGRVQELEKKLAAQRSAAKPAAKTAKPARKAAKPAAKKKARGR